MQGMARQDQLSAQLWGPTGFNKLQVCLFASPVDFIADHGKTRVREVHSYLMCAPRARTCTHERHFSSGKDKTPFHTQFGSRLSSALMHAALQPNLRLAHFSLTNDWRVDGQLVPLGLPPHNGEIFFFDGTALHIDTQRASPR